MMVRNPFGDEPPAGSRRTNPFGEDAERQSVEEAAGRMEHAARKIRALRVQLGSEGLTLPATRELIDEVASAIEAAARALRGLEKGS